MRKYKNHLNVILLVAFVVLIIVFNFFVELNNYQNRILYQALVFVTLALGLNLINGFVGMFSLGHAGFMAIGAYTVGLLTMSDEDKIKYFINVPIADWLLGVNVPYIVALLLGMLFAGIIGLLISVPILRLTDDYLAIATLGFSEIIRLLITIAHPITNGPLGLKGVPTHPSILWPGVFALISILFMIFFTSSSHGKALVSIRENEIAAQSIGINLFINKVLAFTIGSAMAGLGGGLLIGLLGSATPTQFIFTMTFNILLIVVIGGMGNIWGSVVASFVVVYGLEYLRILDEPFDLGFIQSNGLPGLRMVVFSLILILTILFKSDGNEGFFSRLRRRPNAKN